VSNIFKSKIFWTNIIASSIAFLGLLDSNTIKLIGIENTAQFLSIIGLLTTALNIILRIWFNTGSSIKIGGRPRRKKKPTSRVNLKTLQFDTQEETFMSQGFQIGIDEIVALPNNAQQITFDTPITGELDEITVEFE
jgi:hypothetical protein